MELTFQNRYGTQVRRSRTHIYLAPHPALRSFIAHYTYCLPLPFRPPSQADPQPASRLTLVPDASGCLVFTLSTSGFFARLYGPSTLAVSVTNDLGIGPPRFFVEFHPGGLFAFTGIPQWELADRVWPLSDAAPDLHALALASFYRARDLDDFAHRMDAALLAYTPVPAPVSPFLVPSVDSLWGDLAAASGYSPRHLSRLFREGAGMGYKSYLRVLRVNAATRRLRSHTFSRTGGLSLTALAHELGYFDQSHFIHDFKATCGVTPGAYRADLSDFYNEPLKF